MKRLLMILCFSGLLSACTKYEEFPFRPVSFEIDGKEYYSPKDTQTMTGSLFGGAVQVPDTLRISESDDGMGISYVRSTDFMNYDMVELGLELKGLDAVFAEKEYRFSESDQLSSYPYVYLHPVKTSTASDYDLYTAVEGRIEFYEINYEEEYVSGIFEFKAVKDDVEDCDHPDIIYVKNGMFRNIPFTIVKDERL